MSSFAQTKKTHKIEDDGFEWYQISLNGKYGAQDVNGRTLIMPEYDLCFYNYLSDGCFQVKLDGNYGAFTKEGLCVISPSRGYDSGCKQGDAKDGYYYSVEKNGCNGACDAEGREIIAPNPKYKLLFYSSVDKCFNYKDEEGKYVSLGIKLDGTSVGGTSSYASTSSSSSSSTSNTSVASSTSSSTSFSYSTRSESKPAWKYRGVYNQVIAEGTPMEGTVQTVMTFFDDCIMFSSVEEPDRLRDSTMYNGTQGDYKVYTKTYDFGPMLGKSVNNYYVDKDYNVIQTINGQETRMWRDGESAGTRSRASSGGYNSGYGSGYGTDGSSSSGTSSGGTTSQPKLRTRCPNCTNGRRVYESTYGGYGGGLGTRLKRCSECGEQYNAQSIIHRHDRCTTCHGTGYLD